MLILNGKLTDKEIIHLDRGFFFGYGLFETILVKNGQPIFLEEHLNRLNAGLNQLNIDQMVHLNDILNQIKVFRKKDYALKITVTDQNILLSSRDLTYNKENYEKGMSLNISKVRRNPSAYTTYLKSLNYTDNMIEKENSVKLGYDETLFLNTEGFISEGSMSNVFLIINDQIHTPSVECGLLNGIIRAWITKYYNVIEDRYTLNQLLNSDGLFITNSLMGIMKVNKVGETPIKDHPMIKKLQEEYNDLLEVCSHESAN